MSPLEYFNNVMQAVRQQHVNGEVVHNCTPCYNMDKYGKTSGRAQQLIKTGIDITAFEKSLLSSEWKDRLTDSTAQIFPVDWQIDLGNYCNNACIFCKPESSSRLAHDLIKAKIIDSHSHKNWTDDPDLVDKFVNDLVKLNQPAYLHFIGGETLIIPAFKRLINEIVAAGVANKVIIGFTTNLSSWDDSIVHLLHEFRQVHVGLSIESLDEVNDYVRYGSNIADAKAELDRWASLNDGVKWLIQLRTTPTIFTVHKLIPIYEYALANSMSVESCNFLEFPEYMRPTVLPDSVRATIVEDLTNWRDSTFSEQVSRSASNPNARAPSVVESSLYHDVTSYINYLNSAPSDTYRFADLISFITKIEAVRKNSILDYVPVYTELFIRHGYQRPTSSSKS
jgi:hypothetical protein